MSRLCTKDHYVTAQATQMVNGWCQKVIEQSLGREMRSGEKIVPEYDSIPSVFSDCSQVSCPLRSGARHLTVKTRTSEYQSRIGSRQAKRGQRRD